MSPSTSSDLDLPIAHHNDKQSCTTHFISNFISYDRLIPLSCQFALSICFVSLPESLQEVILYPEWKQVMDEEMDALLSC